MKAGLERIVSMISVVTLIVTHIADPETGNLRAMLHASLAKLAEILLHSPTR